MKSHHRGRRLLAAVAGAVMTCTLALAPATSSQAAIVDNPITRPAADAALDLVPIGTFETGIFDESASEIVVAHGDRLYVVNAHAGSVSVLDMSDPTQMSELYAIEADGIANSVAIRADGLGVIAFEAETKTDAGRLVFFDANADEATVLGSVEVGALPDMVTISGDGRHAVVANEGEPADDFSIDPEGSIGVVTLPDTVTAPGQDDVRIADFHDFEGDNLPDGVRVFGPAPHGNDLPVSRNLEPEYITVHGDTAYASLQEANAIAVIDLTTATVTDLLPLGFKDHGLVGLDPSDRDPEDAPSFNLNTYAGLYGMYMPDAISSYEVNGQVYLVTANEGDAREWGDYVDAVRVKDLAEDGYGPVCENSPLADRLGDDELGRLNVSIEDGFNGECYEELYAYGARSFSIWTTDGKLVFDSGSDFEQFTHDAAPEFFNSNHSESNLEGRSDDKGPEPEALTIGEIDGRTYAFIGMERVGGVAAYDITDPTASQFVTYTNNRDFSISVEDADDPSAVLSQAGDLGPEGIFFITAENSPTGEPLLAVGNEVSGTTTLFSLLPSTTTDLQVLTINDFHGRIEPNFANGEAGAAVLAGAVNQYRSANPNTLFVSAGDNIGASTFTSFIDRDNPTIDALVAAGLDLSAVGNHEFDRGFADLRDRVIPRYGDQDFALAANVYDTDGNTVLREYAIREVDGVRVAFIATVTEQTASMVSPDGIAGLTFGDQLAAANRVAEQLTANDQADVIILLTHDGAENQDCAAIAAGSSDYAQLVRGASEQIDAIVSGHTHQDYNCEIAGPGGVERPVIQAHQYGTTLGLLDISYDKAHDELLSISGSTVPLVADEEPLFGADQEVTAIVDAAVEVADREGSVPVGRISGDIVRGGDPAGDDRGVESSMGNLIADVYLWATTQNPHYNGTRAQIGIMNPGGLRDDLHHGEDGTVSYRDVANVQPFANTLVTTTLTGEQLRQVLEEQWQPEGSSRPKLHLGISAGFSYVYDPKAPDGEHIVSMTLDGVEITDGQEIVIVTNSFLAAGGDNFFTLAEGSSPVDTGQVDLAATVDYFAGRDVVDPAPLGRAVVKTDEPDTDEPDTDDPGTDDPGTDEPGVQVELSADSVRQGESVTVTVRGLAVGERVGAVLHSDTLVITGIPAAGEDGVSSFEVRVPADFEVGEHRLVITTEDGQIVAVGLTILPGGDLADTGSSLGWPLIPAAVLVLVAGAVLTGRQLRAAR